jgi:amino acid transporter
MYTIILFGLLLLGIRPVGVTLNLLLVLVLFPTFLLFVIGIFQVDFSKVTNVTQPKNIDESSHNFFHFLNVLIWNYSAFDQVSLVSSEVEDAGYHSLYLHL